MFTPNFSIDVTGQFVNQGEVFTKFNAQKELTRSLGPRLLVARLANLSAKSRKPWSTT